MFSGVAHNAGDVEPYERDQMTLRFSQSFSQVQNEAKKKTNEFAMPLDGFFPRFIFRDSNRGHIQRVRKLHI